MIPQTPTAPSLARRVFHPANSQESLKDVLLSQVADAVGYKSLQRYKTRCEFVFDQVPLADKRVLDVGAGAGGLTFWAALHGASSVVALEPEADGSVSGSASTFKALAARLGLKDTAHISSAYLQELNVPHEERFDVAVLYDVINHLDESAVSALPDESAQEAYVSILTQLRRVLTTDALVVVADCGRENLWKQFGLRSPFAPTIEWHKHQQPEIWIDVFRRAGFELCDLRWSPIYPFGRLSSRRSVQYAFSSHFVLRFRVTNSSV